MKQPDTVLAKYLFLVFVVFLVIFTFSVSMWVLNLSGSCYRPIKQQENKKNKSYIAIIILLLFIIVCSMAAQAVDQSYQKVRL